MEAYLSLAAATSYKSMKRVYTADSVAMAWHVRNVLEQYDIAATARNDKLYSVAGEVPFIECLPQAWVEKPLDIRRAEQIIAELVAESPSEGKDWVCENCGEGNATSFALCWNCQHSIPSNC